jgi:dihydroxyacid dehydratase/phosphogluconate dehydratase
MAKSVDLELTQDDVQRISDRIPVLADFKPSGKYLMQDLHQHGGVPAVMKYLLQQGPVAWRLPDGNRQHIGGEFSRRAGS